MNTASPSCLKPYWFSFKIRVNLSSLSLMSHSAASSSYSFSPCSRLLPSHLAGDLHHWEICSRCGCKKGTTDTHICLHRDSPPSIAWVEEAKEVDDLTSSIAAPQEIPSLRLYKSGDLCARGDFTGDLPIAW